VLFVFVGLRAQNRTPAVGEVEADAAGVAALTDAVACGELDRRARAASAVAFSLPSLGPASNCSTTSPMPPACPGAALDAVLSDLARERSDAMVVGADVASGHEPVETLEPPV
jgi:hypothetical protein